MGKIDVAKEKINYLKVWLGISVVTLIGLIGWLSSHFEELSSIRLILSFVSIAWLLGLIQFLNKTILQKINSLEDL